MWVYYHNIYIYTYTCIHCTLLPTWGIVKLLAPFWTLPVQQGAGFSTGFPNMALILATPHGDQLEELYEGLWDLLFRPPRFKVRDFRFTAP